MTSRALSVVAAPAVGLEVLAILATGIWVAAQVTTGPSEVTGPALGLAAVAVGVAALLALALRALLRSGSGPARGWLVTWQLVQAGVAGTVLGAGGARPAVTSGAAAAVLLAVVVVVALVADARRARRGRSEPGQG